MPPLFDPLRSEIAPAQTLEGKRRILIGNLLCNHSGAGDIPLSTPTVPTTFIPFPQITEFEASQAVLGAENTTPGKDGIPTAILRLAWSQISTLVLDLFQACVEIGYHTHYFRVAILAIIEKPKKIDKSIPRSYRPIALLSVLGKSLEKLIAKRMSWIVSGCFNTLQRRNLFITKCSCVDGSYPFYFTICETTIYLLTLT